MRDLTSLAKNADRDAAFFSDVPAESRENSIRGGFAGTILETTRLKSVLSHTLQRVL